MLEAFTINLEGYNDYGLTYVQVIEYSSLPKHISFESKPAYACIQFSQN
jgi:hypothetical protein